MDSCLKLIQTLYEDRKFTFMIYQSMVLQEFQSLLVWMATFGSSRVSSSQYHPSYTQQSQYQQI